MLLILLIYFIGFFIISTNLFILTSMSRIIIGIIFILIIIRLTYIHICFIIVVNTPVSKMWNPFHSKHIIRVVTQGDGDVVLLFYSTIEPSPCLYRTVPLSLIQFTIIPTCLDFLCKKHLSVFTFWFFPI